MDSSRETEHQDHPETNVPPPAQRSAEMPMLWDEAHRSLIDTCVRHESLLELFLQLRRLADVLDENQTMKENDFPVFSTVNSLRHYDWTMCELLHSMSVPVVQSIVKNTFAFDVTNNAIKPFQLPSALLDGETPGVYVVGIRMKNRDGQFLNINELELLIDDMNQYTEGYEAYARHGGWATANMTPAERKAINLINAVDSHCGAQRDPNSGPCFIEKAEEVPRIKALIKTFEGMCDRSLDPTGRLYISQSPLYVGCSKDLNKRMRVYARHSVKGINKPLGLTVCILRKHNRSPELVTGCVLRILKKQQLAMAEQLVCTIAGSLIYEHGFNAVETGGAGPKSLPTDAGLKDNIKYIICGTQVLISNLKESLGEVDLRQRFLLHLDQASGEIVRLKQILKECQDEIQHLPSGQDYDQVLSDISSLVRNVRHNLKDKRDALKFWQLMFDIQNIIVDETGLGLHLIDQNS
ncbi:hypothetical protein Focb16_v014394 [Fusarium oxysporum f. sp. cubense]|uniref:Uncharacterized protein n=1 Tax=Fusarium oxysporum f. sp. cubense TaxID=61366 RepID=A0A559KTM4_FUSOC|nr:hypothetical protein Focb16_v014394 [Fusarium oxysporum f. sp. cubense]